MKHTLPKPVGIGHKWWWNFMPRLGTSSLVLEHRLRAPTEIRRHYEAAWLVRCRAERPFDARAGRRAASP